MFVVYLLLVVAIGLSFIVHTERQSVIRQMSRRASVVMDILKVGLISGRIPLSLVKHDAKSACIFPLSQLTQHYQLSLQITTEDYQQILDCSYQYVGMIPEQSYQGWFKRLISVESLLVEDTVSLPSSHQIKVVLDVKPALNLQHIKQRLFSFLIVMGLLAVLVFAAIKIMMGRLIRELDIVNKAIRQIEADHYHARLPDFYFAELTDISDSYNQAMNVLEKRRRENQTLAERLLWLQEEERRYLAQELHDELGQSISAIKVMCISMQKSERYDREKTDKQANETLAIRCQSITDICDHLYTVVRDLMKRLRPTVLDELGLKAALEEVGSNWQLLQPEIAIHFTCDDDVEQCDDNIKINLYRIVQESLTNIVKHADAHRIGISLRKYHSRSRPWAESTYYQLDIEDDGKGFNATDKRFGFGLVGMRERVKSMSGTISIDSKPGSGTKITVQVPVSIR